jgi:hypothetical protein
VGFRSQAGKLVRRPVRAASGTPRTVTSKNTARGARSRLRSKKKDMQAEKDLAEIEEKIVELIDDYHQELKNIKDWNLKRNDSTGMV